MVICWKKLLCSTYCFMISICDAESEFNDGTNERYHLLIYHKELEQLKPLEHEKLLLLKSPQNAKKQYQILPSLRKKKNNKSDIYQKYFQIFRYEPSMWRSFVKNTFVNLGDLLQLVTNRFDRNIYCTVSGDNFVYSFRFLRNWSIQSYSANHDCALLNS